MPDARHRRYTCLLLVVAGCARAPREPLPTDAFDAAEAAAAALVHDPARGGPPVQLAASPLPPFLGVDRGADPYIGSAACMMCHATAAAAWEGSAHAHAIDTLVASARDADPSCLRCHTTGLGHPGGFGAPDSPALDAVGCEACHGPGSSHAANRAPGYGALPRDQSACVACHTHDTAPDFQFNAWWAKIAH